MEDVISLSSGSEEDSDIEIVGSYNDNKEDAVPFVRAELLAVTPILIDITGHQLGPFGIKPRRVQSSSVEVIDLRNDGLLLDHPHLDEKVQSKTSNHKWRKEERHHEGLTVSTVTKSCGKVLDSPCPEILKNNVIELDCGDKGGQSPDLLSSGQDKSCMVQDNVLQSRLEETNPQKPVNISFLETQCHLNSFASEMNEPEDLHTLLNEFLPTCQTFNSVEGIESQYTNRTQSAAEHSMEPHTEHNEKFGTWNSPESWLDKPPSPFSLDSPYYCPSEVDPVFFSDESVIPDKFHVYTTGTFCEDISGVCQADSTSKGAAEATCQYENQHVPLSPVPEGRSQVSSQTLPIPRGASLTQSPTCGQEQPVSPTSTEILAGESPETLDFSPDLAMESPPISPLHPNNVHPADHFSAGTVAVFSGGRGSASSERPSSSQLMSFISNEENEMPDVSDCHPHERQHISLTQFKKLKHLIGGEVRHVHGRNNEEHVQYGLAEPLCRQSLSLVYSTIEESYPEGTLQLLSDLIQPRFYPPTRIISHLLRDILLDPQSDKVLATEAYNLLMRTQKYHPAEMSTVTSIWDWELLSSVMSEQDKARKLRVEVRCLLFEYVLRVMQDDFQSKLSALQLSNSVAKHMLSCYQKFSQVRDLLNWLLDTAKQSFCNSENKEKQKWKQNCCLKLLVVLQKMLLLAVEVDRTPTLSSNKISDELCYSLNLTAPSRAHRLLLISTLESNLLRCKLLMLLLDQACSQKSDQPMSLKRLLHFLEASTLAPDPSDGTERWRRWDELLQLVWMLMLSYEDVVTGHLRFSITERFAVTRAPMWTPNDQLTQAAVQEAAEAFLSRAGDDLGQALPSQVQESLAQLQTHLLSIILYSGSKVF